MLSAIIVNHRSNPLVEACVRSLLGGTHPPDELIIIDNEGLDGGLPVELASDARVRLIVRESNPGYAASCNAGAAVATGDRVAFLNADVTVDRDCIERCLRVLDDDAEVAIVTPRLERPDGTLDHACHRGLPTPGASLAYKLGLHRRFPRSRRMGRYTMAWLDPWTDHDVEACSGAFMLMRRDALALAGGWDERYRFYAEDLDLCLRVGRMGGRIRYLGSARAIHVKGAFSHLEAPDASLDDRQLQVKRWVKREIVASHRLFFEEHLRSEAAAPTRLALELLFAVQWHRAQGSDRATRA